MTITKKDHNMKHLILGSALIISISMGFSATIVVDLAGGGDYTSISLAVNGATAGDTVLIMSGTFQLTSAIQVDKELHIMGLGYDLPESGGTYLLGSTQLFDFTTNADGSSLRSLRLDGNGTPLLSINADDMIIENNHIRNSYSQGYIMILASVSSDTIRNNIITFNEGASYRPGIYLNACTNTVVNNNLIAYCSWQGAVYFNNCTTASAVNNIFLHCQYGIYTIGSSTIANNIFMNNSNGVTVQSGSPSILNNCFFNNSSDGSTGIDPILLDPQFVDYASTDTYTDESYDQDGYDFHLQASSPCIDTGYILVDYNDSDGSQNDLGIYGWKWPMGTNGAPRMPLINKISVSPSGVAPNGTISIEVIGRFGN